MRNCSVLQLELERYKIADSLFNYCIKKRQVLSGMPKMKDYINQLWKLDYIMDNELKIWSHTHCFHHFISSLRTLKEQVTSYNPFNDRKSFYAIVTIPQWLWLHQKLSRKGKELSSPKGISKNEVGPKRTRNPKVLIPLENGKSTENASIKYTLNHWNGKKKSI